MFVWQHVLALFLSLLIHSSQKSALYKVQQQAGDPVWKLHGTNYEPTFYSQEDDSDAKDKEEFQIVHSDQGSVLGLEVKKIFPTAWCRHQSSLSWPFWAAAVFSQHPKQRILPSFWLAAYGWSTKLKTYSYISAGVYKMWDSGSHCSTVLTA